MSVSAFMAPSSGCRGGTPGPENSITKVVSATKLQEISVFGTELQEQAGIINDPAIAAMDAIFEQGTMYAPGLRIAGGTDEILRNIIAERVLGLPADVRVDKGIPFSEVPQGPPKT